MPCKDVTELIEVVIDADDRLKSYTFNKRTCGQAVGAASLLLEQLGGRSIAALSALDADTYLAEFPQQSDVEEFLSLKHLFAIQSVLAVLTGHEPGGPDDVCAAADISYDGNDLVINARISVDLVTEKIKSCGHCKSCGRNKKSEIVFS
ncbi:MAG: hypothetical protein HY706_05285 [Candidatus Hydrogenedentes bacterium]|nr:hypothetical protein [Candidatus Hydrogenedentota bacterium]